MALFGKLFEKKECAICGGEIGMLGNRKLEDGNLCKNCAAKLSPWFDDRRHSTIEQIKEQLAYRQENEKELEDFSVTKTYGESYKLCLDENQKKFIVARTDNYLKENADVFTYEQVKDCQLSISEMMNEEKREVKNQDGTKKKISYAPPRYTYTYNFTIKLLVDHPFIDDIQFKLNRKSVEVHEVGKAVPGRQPGKFDKEYQYYEQMGHEIKQILTLTNESDTEGTDTQSDVGVTTPELVTCPYCGEKVHDGESCELCGGPLK